MEKGNKFTFSGRGEIYSYTVIYNPDDAPGGFEKFTPLAIALIRLDEGPLVTAQLTDLNINLPWQDEYPTNQRVFIGQKVEMVTRKLREDGSRGQKIYGYKFRPPIPKIT